MSNHDSKINFRSTSDGWRGKLAKDFTFDNVELIGKAIANYLLLDIKKKDIVIGYDTRFMSKEFAYFLGSKMQDWGINTHIISRPSPTPLLTFAVVNGSYPLGLNITASHNPPFDNGIKIRVDYGGTPTKNIIEKIESYFGQDISISKTKGGLSVIDPIENYVSKIRSLISFESIAKTKSKIIVDTMHGTTVDILRRVFENTNTQISYLHDGFDPYFGGVNPEPKFESTSELQELVKEDGYDFGIAHDGDGDRIIASLPAVGYLSPHDVSAILVLYLVKYKKLSGKVLGSSTLGRRVKRICDHLKITFDVMPVGFKNATEGMLKGEVLLAAEENGGVGFGFYLPERDTTLAASLLIEAQCLVGLNNLHDEVVSIAGKSGFCRYNHTPSCDRKLLFQKVVETARDFNYMEISSISDLDGVKIVYRNGDWLSIRYSGTEDILRIYCESDSREEAVKIKDFALSKLLMIEAQIK